MSSQRIRYNGEIRKTHIDEIDGTQCVLLQSVQDHFPHVTSFTLNDEPIRFVTDNDHCRSAPWRINAYPDDVLDCIAPFHAESNETAGSAIQRIDKRTEKIYENTSVLFERIESILCQTYELAEFTVPRLFIVLPEKQSMLNSTNLFQHTYRLFFLCEDEKHRHLSLHEGYELKQSSEFLKKYGLYLKDMITVVKYAIIVGNFILPQMMRTTSETDIFKDKYFLSSFSSKLDQLSEILDTVTEEDRGTDMLCQPLEGADLTEIEHYLKKSDEHRTLGNLYRTTTDDGHVRWVCVHHYKKNYVNKKMQEMRREFEVLGGKYNEETSCAFVSDYGEKNMNKMLDAVKKGLPIVTFTIKGCNIREAVLDRLLKLARRHYMKYITFDNITMSSMIGRVQSHLQVIEKLENAINNSENLTIYYRTRTSADVPLLLKALKYNERKSRLKISTSEFNGTTLNLCASKLTIEDNAKAIASALRNKGISVTDMLSVNKTMRELRICHSQYNMKCLCEGLEQNTTLEKLDLFHNEITDDRAMIISQLLMTNTALRELILYNNYITDFGAAALGKALQINTSLKRIDIGHNWIGNDGAKALAEALKINKHLESLEIKRNRITDHGAEAVIKALDENNTLKVLNIYGNDIPNTVALLSTEIHPGIISRSNLTTSKKNNSDRLTVKPDFNFDLNTELSDVLKNDQERRSTLQDLIQNLSKDVVKKNDGQQTTINLDDIDSKLLVNILQPVLNARLEKRLCDERVDEMERYNRSFNLRFQNVPPARNEDSVQLVINVAYEMGIETDYDSIETAHRIPAKQKKLGALKHPPVLIARFHSRPIHRQVLSSKGALSHLHAQHTFSKVKISEDLSRHNLEIFSTARAKLDKGERHRIYSSNGRVFYYADAGKRIHLNSVNSIDAISYQTQIQNPAQTDSTSSQLG
ncbi:unnamed protein product, partial [Didymodactylos carnosus]